MPGRELGRDKGVERAPSPGRTKAEGARVAGWRNGGHRVRSWERKEGTDQGTSVFL